MVNKITYRETWKNEKVLLMITLMNVYGNIMIMVHDSN